MTGLTDWSFKNIHFDFGTTVVIQLTMERSKNFTCSNSNLQLIRILHILFGYKHVLCKLTARLNSTHCLQSYKFVNNIIKSNLNINISIKTLIMQVDIRSLVQVHTSVCVSKTTKGDVF